MNKNDLKIGKLYVTCGYEKDEQWFMSTISGIEGIDNYFHRPKMTIRNNVPMIYLGKTKTHGYHVFLVGELFAWLTDNNVEYNVKCK